MGGGVQALGLNGGVQAFGLSGDNSLRWVEAVMITAASGRCLVVALGLNEGIHTLGVNEDIHTLGLNENIHTVGVNGDV